MANSCWQTSPTPCTQGWGIAQGVGGRHCSKYTDTGRKVDEWDKKRAENNNILANLLAVKKISKFWRNTDLLNSKSRRKATCRDEKQIGASTENFHLEQTAGGVELPLGYPTFSLTVSLTQPGSPNTLLHTFWLKAGTSVLHTDLFLRAFVTVPSKDPIVVWWEHSRERDLPLHLLKLLIHLQDQDGIAQVLLLL